MSKAPFGMKPIFFNAAMRQKAKTGEKTLTRRAVKPHFRAGEIGWEVVRKECPGGEERIMAVVANDLTGWEVTYKGRDMLFVRAEYYDEQENVTRPLNPPYKVGDVLYIPEPWRCTARWGGIYAVEFMDGTVETFDFADEERAERWAKYQDKRGWQSPYFMPREAARQFAVVTSLDIQRLTNITDGDILKEGVPGDVDYPIEAVYCPCCHGSGHTTARDNNGGIVEVDCLHCDTPGKRFFNLWDSTVKEKNKALYGVRANPPVWVIGFKNITKAEALRLAEEVKKQ